LSDYSFRITSPELRYGVGLSYLELLRWSCTLSTASRYITVVPSLVCTVCLAHLGQRRIYWTLNTVARSLHLSNEKRFVSFIML